MTLSRTTIRTVLLVCVSVILAAATWWLSDEGGDNGDFDSVRDLPSASAGEIVPETDPASGLLLVDLSDLPVQAQSTVALIDRGGPYPYDKDGSTFGNFEGLLPQRERGYYAEYTVPTPGSGDRGARRIVAGDQEELFYTGDHYESFVRVLR